MLRIIQRARPQVENFLDFGCGDGILGRVILTKYPPAKGVFLDFLERMIQAAKSKGGESRENLEFIMVDLGNPLWAEAIAHQASFDIIVSGFAIHHPPDGNKKDIYGKIYELLQPGGVFLNLEHVSSASKWIEEASNELFIDSLYAFHQAKGSNKSRDDIAQEYYHRQYKGANILAPVETQCNWLKAIDFTNVDCYFKIFELALFGGMRSADT